MTSPADRRRNVWGIRSRSSCHIKITQHATDIIVTVSNAAQSRRFCTALGAPEWADDARFATNTVPRVERQSGAFLTRNPQRDVPGLDALVTDFTAGYDGRVIQMVTMLTDVGCR